MYWPICGTAKRTVKRKEVGLGGRSGRCRPHAAARLLRGAACHASPPHPPAHHQMVHRVVGDLVLRKRKQRGGERGEDEGGVGSSPRQQPRADPLLAPPRWSTAPVTPPALPPCFPPRPSTSCRRGRSLEGQGGQHKEAGRTRRQRRRRRETGRQAPALPPRRERRLIPGVVRQKGGACGEHCGAWQWVPEGAGGCGDACRRPLPASPRLTRDFLHQKHGGARRAAVWIVSPIADLPHVFIGVPTDRVVVLQGRRSVQVSAAGRGRSAACGSARRQLTRARAANGGPQHVGRPLSSGAGGGPAASTQLHASVPGLHPP